MSLRLLALAGAAAVLLGSTAPEFWNAKEVSAWTKQDAQQLMTDSPWAKEKPLPISQRPHVSYLDAEPAANGSSVPTAELGNAPANRNGAPVSRTPSLASAPVGAPTSQPLVKVIWASALPVRLAVLKLRTTNGEPSAEQFAKVNKEWPNYVIAVVGLPAPEAGSDPKALAGGASLFVSGKPPAAALDSDYRRVGQDDVYFFRFAKAAFPLTSAEDEVEFKLTFGTMKISQKFRLSKMKYQGELAL